jgi:hypothetical protein
MPEKTIEAFDNLKSPLHSEPVLAYPRSNRTFSLTIGAAMYSEEEKGGVGAILYRII